MKGQQEITSYHQGKWIAVNPERELIASASSIGDLRTELEKKPDEHILVVMRVPQKGDMGE